VPNDRELLTAKQIAEEFHMASAAVARGWLQRWEIPHKFGRDSRHTHHYSSTLVRLIRRLQMSPRRTFLITTYLPRAEAGASTDTLIALLQEEAERLDQDEAKTARNAPEETA
jgi:hypothetical protein